MADQPAPTHSFSAIGNPSMSPPSWRATTRCLGTAFRQVEKELKSRLSVLTIGPAHAERKTVQGALRALAVLKAERLGNIS